MIVQWCIKGMSLLDDNTARSIIDDRGGIVSNWWREVGTISPQERRDKLTPANLDMHVNHYTSTDPVTGKTFDKITPFISLSAGNVSRDAVARTNTVQAARHTALWFGTEFGTRTKAYLYICWVPLAPRQAVEIEGMAEEVRDLNTYRRYSSFQTEGEITAKVDIPDNQIQACEKWEYDRPARRLRRSWVHPNPRFTLPEQLSNVRELI